MWMYVTMEVLFSSNQYTTDSRYIAVQYNTILYKTHKIRWYNFGRTSDSKDEQWVSFMSYLEKTYREISGVHYTNICNYFISIWKCISCDCFVLKHASECRMPGIAGATLLVITVAS